MARARDIAAYLLAGNALEPLELQKILYYSQAWHLVWEGAPLFSETIRAWDRGPVVGEVWHDITHGTLTGDASTVTAGERATIAAVRDFYGSLSGMNLSELTHLERPWADAYRPVRPNPVITHDAMRAFYGAVAGASREKVIPESYRRGVAFMMTLSPDELADLADTTTTPFDLSALGGDACPF
jgi:uncharacterized phage-associated protein